MATRTIARLYVTYDDAAAVANELGSSGISQTDIIIIGQGRQPEELVEIGGLLDALTGAGVDREEATAYHEGVRRGCTLVTVRTLDADQARVEVLMACRSPVDWRAAVRDEWAGLPPAESAAEMRAEWSGVPSAQSAVEALREWSGVPPAESAADAQREWSGVPLAETAADARREWTGVPPAESAADAQGEWSGVQPDEPGAPGGKPRP